MDASDLIGAILIVFGVVVLTIVFGDPTTWGMWP
jgi:hypothetical protein